MNDNPPSSAFARTISAAAILLSLLAGCSSNGDPFSYVKVSETVTYEDGSKIPASDLELWFFSEAEAIGNAHPKPGMVIVNSKTGEFADVTTHTFHDGLVRGKHRVIVTGGDHGRLPKNIVPAEYGDPKKSPLEVDTAQQPFRLKVRLPRRTG
jgi:hypothetical protein